MLEWNNCSQLINKIQFYAKNINRIVSYWNSLLKVTLQQHGAPTIFLCRLVQNFICRSSMHHLVTWTLVTLILKVIFCNIIYTERFFTERNNAFVKHLICNIRVAEYHWYRSEYAVVRGTNHCHGQVKLKSDLGLRNLASKAVLAK